MSIVLSIDLYISNLSTPLYISLSLPFFSLSHSHSQIIFSLCMYLSIYPSIYMSVCLSTLLTYCIPCYEWECEPPLSLRSRNKYSQPRHELVRHVLQFSYLWWCSFVIDKSKPTLQQTEATFSLSSSFLSLSLSFSLSISIYLSIYISHYPQYLHIVHMYAPK